MKIITRFVLIEFVLTFVFLFDLHANTLDKMSRYSASGNDLEALDGLIKSYGNRQKFITNLLESQGRMGLGQVKRPMSCNKRRIRPYPYPFGSVFSFSSDVDLQTPDEGLSFHKMVNSDYGLMISDSLWPQGSNIFSSYLLNVADSTPNLNKTKINGLPVYFSLLREWHNGNIDHFHSWQDDDIPILRQNVEPPLKLGDKTSLRFKQLGKYPFKIPHIFRVIVSSELDDQSHVALLGKEGEIARFSIASARVFRRLKFDLTNNTKTVSFASLKGRKTQGIMEAFERNSLRSGYFVYEFDFPSELQTADSLNMITSITVSRQSCAGHCIGALHRVEFSPFGRINVERSMPWLRKNGIIPNYISSHGGWSIAQNYSPIPFIIRLGGENLKKMKLFETDRFVTGAQRYSSGYHIDIIKNMGVKAVWPYLKGGLYLLGGNESPPNPLAFSNTRIYQIDRNVRFPKKVYGDPQHFVDMSEKWLGSLTERDRHNLKDAICPSSCAGQGDGAAMTVMFTLARMRQQLEADTFWYTHFGSGGDPTYKPTLKSPFRPQTRRAMAELAAAYYGWDHNFPKFHRPWVIPTASYISYWINRQELEKHTKIDFDRSIVEIENWIDPVTGITIPTQGKPEADLHGMTFYVANPDMAKVTVNGREIKSITVNPVDECGKKSITIVDHYTPTSIVNNFDAQESSTVRVKTGSLIVPSRKMTATIETGNNMIQSDAEGNFNLEFQPNRAQIHNEMYLSVELDQDATTADLQKIDLNIEIETEKGILTAATCQNSDCKPSKGGVVKIPVGRLHQSGKIILPFYHADWSSQQKCSNNDAWSNCPVLRGEVKKVTIFGRTASPGERLAIKTLSLLRPNALVVNNKSDKVVIGGHVKFSGQKGQNEKLSTIIEMSSNYYNANVNVLKTNKAIFYETKTTKNGIFLFHDIPLGSILDISLKFSDGRSCRPSNIGTIIVERHDLNFNIDIAKHCKKGT